jgi:Ca-activated chloride channel family protein
VSVSAQDPTPPKPLQTPIPVTPKPGDDIPVITGNTDVITMTITVTDPFSRYVSGLSKKHFKVYDDNEEQEITFFSDDDAPVSVGIVFDLSGSMSGDRIRRARMALSKFMETSHDKDEYFLIGFNSRAQLLLDRTRDSEAVLSKLTFVEPKNNTALYDACYLGVEKVQRGTHKKRALLVISDVVVYAVGIVGNDSLGVAGQATLEELAGASGGKAFFPGTSPDMDDIFERIALELRNQYSIGYTPKNFSADGRWHKIKVKVTPPRGMPRLTVRTREGYYASPNPR